MIVAKAATAWSSFETRLKLLPVFTHSDTCFLFFVAHSSARLHCEHISLLKYQQTDFYRRSPKPAFFQAFSDILMEQQYDQPEPFPIFDSLDVDLVVKVLSHTIFGMPHRITTVCLVRMPNYMISFFVRSLLHVPDSGILLLPWCTVARPYPCILVCILPCCCLLLCVFLRM